MGGLKGLLEALIPSHQQAQLLLNPHSSLSREQAQALWDQFVAYRKDGYVRPFHVRRSPYKCRMYAMGPYIVKEYTGARQKVESEIRILQQLAHEGLVSYEFAADQGGRISIIMAWAGAPLRDHRAAHPEAYTEDAARHMAHQLASALAFLHTRGILHRDIKPDNLGVSPEFALRLFDWGEAVTMAEVAAMGDRELSRRVGVAGTPLFMPPESLNHLTRRPSEDGNGGDCGTDASYPSAGGLGPDGVPLLRSTLSPALDVWGLGTVVYFLLAGRDPLADDCEWELEEMADVVNRTGGVELPEGATASYAARDFLSRCLERCPARRASAAELLQHPWLRGAASAADVEAARAVDATARLTRSRSGSGLSRRGSSGRLSPTDGDGTRPARAGSMRRSSSGRLTSVSSLTKLAAATGSSGSGSAAPRPPLVEGAATCEVTVRMRPSSSCSALAAHGNNGA